MFYHIERKGGKKLASIFNGVTASKYTAHFDAKSSQITVFKKIRQYRHIHNL